MYFNLFFPGRIQRQNFWLLWSGLVFCAIPSGPIAAKPISDYRWESFYESGKAHEELNRLDNAYYYYEKAERWMKGQKATEVQKAELYNAMGRIRQKQNKPYEAEIHFRKSLLYKEDQANIHLFLGAFQYERRRYTEAAQHYGRYLSLVNKDPDAARAAAIAYARSGQPQQGRELLLPYVSNNEDIRRECASLSLQSPQETLLACHKRALTVNPLDAESLREMWRTSYALFQARGNREHLLDSLFAAEQLHFLFPEIPEGGYYYALSLLSEKKYGNAAQVLAGINGSEGMELPALMMEAELRKRTGERDRSEEIYSAVSSAVEKRSGLLQEQR